MSFRMASIAERDQIGEFVRAAHRPWNEVMHVSLTCGARVAAVAALATVPLQNEATYVLPRELFIGCSRS
jgi:hypothetical protein